MNQGDLMNQLPGTRREMLDYKTRPASRFFAIKAVFFMRRESLLQCSRSIP
jgi:hypothetical protein